MTWRVVSLSQRAYLSVNHRQLRIALKNTEGEEEDIHHVPMEDILAVVLDTPQVTMSSAMLGDMARMGAVVVTSDPTHMPNGMLLPFHQHSRQAAMAWQQHAWSAAFRKRCWQTIIRAKITNQSHVLQRLGIKDHERLKRMVSHVLSGDKENHEAQAARLYWRVLFPDGFRRHGTCSLNGLLNYAYAIMRALVARALVAHGFLPAFGLHHRNKLNAFNLADDMLEVLRPFCDILAYHHKVDTWHGHVPETLSREDRHAALSITTQQYLLAGQLYSLAETIERMVESLQKASRLKTADALHMPAFAL
ncbi:MAG: type II CRISPR-associated endonuclease Cas1 [Alphaproteobacteria bacterium GM7ARS4]|nr:type II CRISPR-associated endonuclease Cas1 [Alphaproteobacteria bacterium GM7ARS4]